MKLEIYGKKDCRLCESAKKKLNHFLNKWRCQDSVTLSFVDVETEYGAAEGDFYDVFEIPSVLLRDDAGHVFGRWDGCAPPSEELRVKLCIEESPTQGRAA